MITFNSPRFVHGEVVRSRKHSVDILFDFIMSCECAKVDLRQGRLIEFFSVSDRALNCCTLLYSLYQRQLFLASIIGVISSEESRWELRLGYRCGIFIPTFASTELRVTVLFNVNFVFLGAKLSLRLVELLWEIELCRQYWIVSLINITTLGSSCDLLLLRIIY